MTFPSYKDFDLNAFWDDVTAYMRRHNLHISDLADMTGCRADNLRQNFLFRRGVSLAVACRLCAVCDLSLDKYNLAANNVTT